MNIRNPCLAACGAPPVAACSPDVDATAAAPASAACGPDRALQFVCGPKNAEVILRLYTRWLITLGMDGVPPPNEKYGVEPRAGSGKVNIRSIPRH
jgi:hypothetical protein